MTVAELERRLTRMEGMLKMLVQAVAEGEDKDAAYRRGYQAGRAAALRRLDISPDEGLERARGPRRTRRTAA